MKLFDGGRAPNPRRVRVFLAEKGMKVPLVPVDMGAMGHRADEIRMRNPLQRLPVLELDDGTILTESVAICRYFEETHPEPPMFGRTPVEKALIDQWVRRVEFAVMMPVGNFWRHAHPRTAALLTQYKDFGESNKETYRGAQKYVDRELAGREFLVGDSYSIADICLLSTVDFAEWIGLPVEDEFENLKAWRARVKARPSAEA